MTDLTLQQQCVLDVSGELPPKRAQQLHDAVAAYPAALLEYELVRGQFALLKTLPKVTLPAEREAAIKAAITAGIMRAQGAEFRAARQAVRWRIGYRALAGLSAVAAAVVITGSLWVINQNVLRQRQLAIANATESLSDYLQTNPVASTDDPDVSNVDLALTTLASDMTPANHAPDGMARLVDACRRIRRKRCRGCK
jgi:hypothetical protein